MNSPPAGTKQSDRVSILEIIERLHARLGKIPDGADDSWEDAALAAVAGENADSSPVDDAPVEQSDPLVEVVNDRTPPRSVEPAVPTPADVLAAPTSVPDTVKACERGSHGWTLRARGRGFGGVVDDRMSLPDFEWFCPRCGATRSWEDSLTPPTDRVVVDAADPHQASLGQTSFGSEAEIDLPTPHDSTVDQAVGPFAPTRSKATEEPDRVQCPICDEEISEPLKAYRGHEICGACYDALTGTGRRHRS